MNTGRNQRSEKSGTSVSQRVACRRIDQIIEIRSFRPWLTRDQALEEIVETLLDKHRGSSGPNPNT